MTLLTKFYPFVEELVKGTHNLATDTLIVALTNDLPDQADGVLADITQIDYTGLTTRTLTTVSATQTAGVFTLVLNDLVITASSETPFFRYVVVYNDTTASKNLIGFYDYGSSVKLYTGNTLTLDFAADTGVLQIQ